MPNKVALNAVMATLAATMRHSRAFDIVAETAARRKVSIHGMDRRRALTPKQFYRPAHR
jgi:hypothetical protein